MMSTRSLVLTACEPAEANETRNERRTSPIQGVKKKMGIGLEYRRVEDCILIRTAQDDSCDSDTRYGYL